MYTGKPAVRLKDTNYNHTKYLFYIKPGRHVLQVIKFHFFMADNNFFYGYSVRQGAVKRVKMATENNDWGLIITRTGSLVIH